MSDAERDRATAALIFCYRYHFADASLPEPLKSKLQALVRADNVCAANGDRERQADRANLIEKLEKKVAWAQQRFTEAMVDRNAALEEIDRLKDQLRRLRGGNVRLKPADRDQLIKRLGMLGSDHGPAGSRPEGRTLLACAEVRRPACQRSLPLGYSVGARHRTIRGPRTCKNGSKRKLGKQWSDLIT